MNWQLPRSKSHQKGMGLDEVELRETSCTDIKEQKRKIVKLLVTRMSNSNFLKKLVESRPRKLTEVINKEKATTTYITVYK